MKPKGQILIWDVTIPPCQDDVKDTCIVRLLIRLPEKEIRCDYGVPMRDREQNLGYYENLAKEVGFEVMVHEETNQVFFLQLRK